MNIVCDLIYKRGVSYDCCYESAFYCEIMMCSFLYMDQVSSEMLVFI
jgi:hypothetical protein